MTTPHKRGNLSAPVVKRLEPQRIDLSDVEIPHRNSSSKVRDYVPPHQQVRAGGEQFLQIKSLGR